MISYPAARIKYQSIRSELPKSRQRLKHIACFAHRCRRGLPGVLPASTLGFDPAGTWLSFFCHGSAKVYRLVRCDFSNSRLLFRCRRDLRPCVGPGRRFKVGPFDHNAERLGPGARRLLFRLHRYRSRSGAASDVSPAIDVAGVVPLKITPDTEDPEQNRRADYRSDQ